MFFSNENGLNFFSPSSGVKISKRTADLTTSCHHPKAAPCAPAFGAFPRACHSKYGALMAIDVRIWARLHRRPMLMRRMLLLSSGGSCSRQVEAFGTLGGLILACAVRCTRTCAVAVAALPL